MKPKSDCRGEQRLFDQITYHSRESNQRSCREPGCAASSTSAISGSFPKSSGFETENPAISKPHNRRFGGLETFYAGGGETCRSLAEKCGISPKTVYNVIERVIWRGCGLISCTEYPARTLLPSDGTDTVGFRGQRLRLPIAQQTFAEFPRILSLLVVYSQGLHWIDTDGTQHRNHTAKRCYQG